jgi:predicted enzyme related to lactoylglutathione lyase
MNLNNIMIGTEDPQKLAGFYTKLFGAPAWDEGGYTGWQIGTGGLMIGPHDKVHGSNAEPGRIIWNIESDDVKGDFDRLKESGANVVAEPYRPDENADMWIATLADPDGNYFQLASVM